MIPIRDENPTRRKPVLTVTLIAINIAVFIYQTMLGPDKAVDFVMAYGAIPAVLAFDLHALPALPLSWITLITSMFVHGGILHLAGNMLYLWIFGNNIEDHLGRFRFILFYLLAGIVAALAHAIVFSDSLVPMVGASGAISGVLGAYLVTFPKARVVVLVWFLFFLRFVRIPAILVLGLWFLLQLHGGFGSLVGQQEGIAFFAHIGGFVVGILLVQLFRRL
ncbi:MAG: rhomboid family intramembrane serine protease [Calditrichaeota bacterium]|nr:rhomboid family intramembrane serine protease [Calditrichota bacterium]